MFQLLKIALGKIPHCEADLVRDYTLKLRDFPATVMGRLRPRSRLSNIIQQWRISIDTWLNSGSLIFAVVNAY